MNGSALNSDYRPTLWPGVIIDEPEVLDLEVVRSEPPWIYLTQRKNPEGEPASAPLAENSVEQLVARADVSNFESMLELAIAMKGDVVPANRVRWRDVLGSDVGPRPKKMHEMYGDVVRNWSESLGWGTPSDAELFWADEKSGMIRIHAAEVSGRAWALQTALRGLGGLAIVSSNPYGHDDFPIRAKSMSATWLASVFACHLQVFSPQISLTPILTFYGAPVVDLRLAQVPTAFEVAVLQLYNALARGDAPRICPADNIVFTAQVGRSMQDGKRTHRRSDAIYCTPQCQKRIEQRRRRERAKSEKIEEKTVRTSKKKGMKS